MEEIVELIREANLTFHKDHLRAKLFESLRPDQHGRDGNV